jgi:hypothetical protein
VRWRWRWRWRWSWRWHQARLQFTIHNYLQSEEQRTEHPSVGSAGILKNRDSKQNLEERREQNRTPVC